MHTTTTHIYTVRLLSDDIISTFQLICRIHQLYKVNINTSLMQQRPSPNAKTKRKKRKKKNSTKFDLALKRQEFFLLVFTFFIYTPSYHLYTLFALRYNKKKFSLSTLHPLLSTDISTENT